MKRPILVVLVLAALAACDHHNPTAPEQSACKRTIVNADSVHVVTKCPADTARP